MSSLPGGRQARIADGMFDGFRLHQKIADLLKEIVEVERLADKRQTFSFQDRPRPSCGQRRYKEEHTEEPLLSTGIGLGMSKSLQGRKERARQICQCDVDYYEGPAAAGQFPHGFAGNGYYADAPAIGVKDMLEGMLAGGIIINNQYVDVAHGRFSEYARRMDAKQLSWRSGGVRLAGRKAKKWRINYA